MRNRLAAADTHISRRFNGKLDGAAADFLDSDDDTIADQDALAGMAGQNEHGTLSSRNAGTCPATRARTDAETRKSAEVCERERRIDQSLADDSQVIEIWGTLPGNGGEHFGPRVTRHLSNRAVSR